MKKEAVARIKINKLLEEANWRFFDSSEGSANIILENNVKITQKYIDDLGSNFENTKNGFIDFLLLDEFGKPFLVLEAKSQDKSPLSGKEQARKYANSQNIRFVILSNGDLNYFWDIEFDNPQIITKLPTYKDLKNKYLGSTTFNPNPKKLISEIVKEDYIAITQNPNYSSDPSWLNEKTRKEYENLNKLRFLREYQLRAIKSIQKAVSEGKSRFLFEMATGTGKTLISAGVIKLFLRTGNAKRVLFLVDRLELEDQASRNFLDYLKKDYLTVIFKENKDDWRKADIVVSTVQSLLVNDKYRNIFSPTDFDLVISDEAHRSIGGNSRKVFEYFVGYKLGLTATPKDYLKNLVNIDNMDPRKLERRELLDTYKTFGCENSDPTFRYSLNDGVKDKFLVSPIVVDARTDITTELLSEQGYGILADNEEGIKEELFYNQKDFEKKFFSQETNYTFCKSFLEKALRDEISGEIGKTIIFCVRQSHAEKITQILNELAHKMYPGKYNSDFAIQVSSNVTDAKGYTINFANNNLNGHTKFKDGYYSSKTRVCVTVGMMTTGYDCQDLLNICLMRPIFSPTDFIQIKGRGTRKYTFKYKEKNEFGDVEEEKVDKVHFKLFDFFANCEYFEEKFNYDEVLKLPTYSPAFDKPTTTTFVSPKKLEVYSIDPLKTCVEIEIGLDGMKIDRKLFDNFSEMLQKNTYVVNNFNDGNIEKVEDYIKKELFDKPEEYINLDKLRRSLKINWRVGLRDIIDHIFYKTQIPSKEEKINRDAELFISQNTDTIISKNISPDTIKLFFDAYINNLEVRSAIDNKHYQDLEVNPVVNISDLDNLDGLLDPIVEYIKNYIPLNQYIK